jgi:hypothetical protein
MSTIDSYLTKNKDIRITFVASQWSAEQKQRGLRLGSDKDAKSRAFGRAHNLPSANGLYRDFDEFENRLDNLTQGDRIDPYTLDMSITHNTTSMPIHMNISRNTRTALIAKMQAYATASKGTPFYNYIGEHLTENIEYKFIPSVMGNLLCPIENNANAYVSDNVSPAEPSPPIELEKDEKGRRVFAYVARCIDSNGCHRDKFGHSVDPMGARLSGIKTNNPHPVKIVKVIDGGKTMEDFLKRKFKHLQVSDEWHRSVYELIDYIESLPDINDKWATN